MTFRNEAVAKYLVQIVVQASEEVRVKKIEVIGTHNLKNTTIQPCPDHLVVASIVFKLVHGMFETKHLSIINQRDLSNNR